MKTQIKKRIIRTLILMLAGLAIGGAIALYQIQNETASVVNKNPAMKEKMSGVAGVPIGGPFTLVDHNGITVTDKDFSGLYRMIYFGFTYCPAICPTELQKITKALKTLPPEIGEHIQPLFISIDPERDTPEVMKDYVSLFHPRLIGLTGSVEQVEVVKKAYRVYAAKAQSPDMNDYTMDHSSFIYFIGPDDTLLGLYRTEDSADMMAADIARHF